MASPAVSLSLSLSLGAGQSRLLKTELPCLDSRSATFSMVRFLFHLPQGQA